MAALSASGDRTQGLRSVRVPTLVLHGTDDPLATLSGGVATAEAIPGSELVSFEGMGHDLPRELSPAIVDQISALVARGEALGRALRLRSAPGVDDPSPPKALWTPAGCIYVTRQMRVRVRVRAVSRFPRPAPSVPARL